MTTYKNHHRLIDLSNDLKPQDLVPLCQEYGLQLAILTKGYFLHNATMRLDGTILKDQKYRVSRGAWLYIVPSLYISDYLEEDIVPMGAFYSWRDGEIDTWAEKKDGKIFVSLSMLWVPSDQVSVIEGFLDGKSIAQSPQNSGNAGIYDPRYRAQFDEAVNIAIKIVMSPDDTNPETLKQLYGYMIDFPTLCAINCGGPKRTKVSTIERNVRAGGGNPLKDPRFLEALAQNL